MTNIVSHVYVVQVTIPLPKAADDGRPKALQIETAAIVARNYPLNRLLRDSNFEKALDIIRQGWLFKSQDSQKFPHYEHDLRVLPIRLQELLQQKVRTGRVRGETDVSSHSYSSSGGGRGEVGDSKRTTVLAPEETRSEMSLIEGWYVSTSCVHLSFVSHLTQEGTMHTTTLIDDFPIHIWLFLPPSFLDSSASTPSPPRTSHPTPSTPHLSSSSPGPPLSTPEMVSSNEPRISFLAHLPTPLCVEIERLQILFLFRLKESLTSFKTSLMRFLDPHTFSPQLRETLQAHDHGNKDGSEQLQPNTPSVSISGYVAVSCMECSLLLPSLYVSRFSQATNTDPNMFSSTNTGREESEESFSGRAHVSKQINVTHTDEQAKGQFLPSKPSSQSSRIGGQTCSTSSNVEVDEQGKLPDSGRVSPVYVQDVAQDGVCMPSSESGVCHLPVPEKNDIGRQSSEIDVTHRNAMRSASCASSDSGGIPSPSGSLISLPVILEQHTHRKNSSNTGAHNYMYIAPARSFSSTDLSPTTPVSSRGHGDGGVATSSSSDLSHGNSLVKDGVNASPVYSRKAATPSSEFNEDEFILVDDKSLGNGDNQLRSHSDGPQVQSRATPTIPKPMSPTSLGTISTPSSLSTPPSTGNCDTPPYQSNLPTSPPTPVSRQRIHSPLCSIPQFVLHAQLRHVCALLNLQSEDIGIRFSADTIHTRELTSNEYQGMQEMRSKKGVGQTTPPGDTPTIKGRLEVGKKVQRFFPLDCQEEQDIIVIISVKRADLTLLLPNMNLVNDFVKDEYEQLKPTPLHLKVEGSRAVLVEDVWHGADHPQSMVAVLEQLEVHKGRELAQGLDIFREDLHKYVPV